MFLLPLLLLAGVAYAVYVMAHRQPHPAAAGSPSALDATPGASFWPTSTHGKLGVGALVLMFLTGGLVNVVQVPFVQWFLAIAATALTGTARFRSLDRSASVLIVFLVSTLAVVAGLLFLAGEVFIGHE